MNQPEKFPGSDWVTLTPHGPFIDTGVDVPFEKRGRMYLAVDTIREMATVAGLFDAIEESITEREHEAYDRGRQDMVKENVDGKLAGSIAELGDLLGVVRDALARAESDPVVPVEGAAAS